MWTAVNRSHKDCDHRQDSWNSNKWQFIINHSNVKRYHTPPHLARPIRSNFTLGLDVRLNAANYFMKFDGDIATAKLSAT